MQITIKVDETFVEIKVYSFTKGDTGSHRDGIESTPAELDWAAATSYPLFNELLNEMDLEDLIIEELARYD